MSSMVCDCLGVLSYLGWALQFCEQYKKKLNNTIRVTD